MCLLSMEIMTPSDAPWHKYWQCHKADPTKLEYDTLIRENVVTFAATEMPFSPNQSSHSILTEHPLQRQCNMCHSSVQCSFIIWICDIKTTLNTEKLIEPLMGANHVKLNVFKSKSFDQRMKVISLEFAFITGICFISQLVNHEHNP